MTPWRTPTIVIGRDPIVTIALIRALAEPEQKSTWEKIWNWLVER
jgi:hypothetical protein